ncbi:hypothetical protein MMC2321_00514 [Chitinophaga sp. MM2321]
MRVVGYGNMRSAHAVTPGSNGGGICGQVSTGKSKAALNDRLGSSQGDAEFSIYLEEKNIVPVEHQHKKLHAKDFLAPCCRSGFPHPQKAGYLICNASPVGGCNHRRNRHKGLGNSKKRNVDARGIRGFFKRIT